MSFREWLHSLRRLSVTQAGISFVIYTMILLATVSFVMAPHELPSWRFYATLLALAALTVLYLLPPSATRALTPRELFLRELLPAGLLVLGINALGLQQVSFLPYLLFMLVGHSVTVLPLLPALLYSAALLGSFLLILHWSQGVPPTDIVYNALSIAFGMAFTAIFSLLAVRYGEQSARATALLAELRAANEALRAARERERELAVAEERLRLARDIHDGLGHHLTVLNVQLQAAAKLIERDPARAAAAIATSKEVAAAALTEVRQSIASLRRTPLDGRTLDEAIRQLVHDFDRHSPIEARFEQQGRGSPVPPAAAMTLYRAAQEGLTNVQKHATAQRATVALRFERGAVAVAVWNDGQASPANSSGSGFGLAGLRERAEQLGGALHAGPGADGGFHLTLSLPLAGQEAEEVA